VMYRPPAATLRIAPTSCSVALYLVK